MISLLRFLRMTFSIALMLTLASTATAQQQVQAELADAPSEITSYMRDTGVDAAEATLRFRLQHLAGDLDAELQAREKATFAGLWIQHTPTFRVIVQFTGDGPKDLAAYLKDKALAPYIEVRRATISYERLRATQQLVLTALRGKRFDSGINIPSNRVEVYAVDAQPLQQSLMAVSFPLPAHAQIVPVTQLSRDEADIYGGVPLTTCTAGWSVRNSAGTLGIITSAHCGNSQSYKGSKLPYVSGVYSGSCDVQWHTDGPYTAVPRFIASSTSTTRAVNALRPRNNQAVGDYVCKRGKTTGYTCGYIKDKDFRPSQPSDAAATYIRVHANVNLSEGGDSGGPWFNGNTAYGIHKCGIGNDACYMAINYVSSCLGVSLLTQ